MPSLIVGSTPRGDDYFGQDDLIHTLWSRLVHDNVLLVAPRRFGKTGAMYRLLDDPHESFRPLYINVEHIMSAADFMVEFLATLLRHRHFSRYLDSLWESIKGMGHTVRDNTSSIDLGGLKVALRDKTDVRQEWIAYGERAISLLAKSEPALLLLIDEFAVMIDEIARRNRDEVVRLLRWFRTARTAPETQTRFVISGSINLIATLDGLGLVDTVNDLAIETLKPFSAETAGRYIDVIFSSRAVTLTPDVRGTILDLVGTPIPYLLAVLLTAIFDRQRTTGAPVSRAMVQAAFDEDLLGGATSAVFQHYRSRITQYYPGPQGQAAKAILGLLSRSGRSVRRDTLYQRFLQASNRSPQPEALDDFLRLMYKLDNDFYIVLQDEHYTFFSRVLQVWWKTHYGFQEG